MTMPPLSSPKKAETPQVIRLAPYLASRTHLSRRQAEEALLQGRVKIDGQVVQGFHGDISGTLTLDDHLVPHETAAPRLWIYYKPPGYLVTRTDPQGRPTVFERLLPHIDEPRLISVGRLDYDSEGLLLLTNAPLLAHTLETSRLARQYEVWVQGDVHEDYLELLRKGASVDGIRYRPCQIKILSTHRDYTRLLVTLREGKKREIRILMALIGLYVQRLIRHSFGPFSLDDLACDQWRAIPVPKYLCDQIDRQHEQKDPRCEEKK
jgi:23S rRNA pseudouridine2605 synthase